VPLRAFLDHPVPFGVAHRGGADDLPENTMPAFAAAVALGYRHVETDAHLSSDGVVFSFHDSVLERVTDRSGALEAVTAEHISGADAAYHFSPDGDTHPLRGNGIGVPTMEELLTTWPDVFVNIDTKSDAVVEPLVALLRRLDALDRVCIGSFRDERLQRVRLLTSGRVCTSLGTRGATAAWIASRSGRMPRQGADCLQVPARRVGVRVVDRLFVSAAHRAGMQVHVWTVDEEAQMHTLLDLGVDAIMTDRPALLRTVMSGRGEWRPRAVAAG
jgi:glycerophosphoryl diester phosphodiesterase